MRDWVVVVIVALAACGDDGTAPLPDANDDIDFDGVKNDVDNCPNAANGFQLNEDGDKFGDACDPCPPIAGDNPPDGDGDGVADACDPLPIIIGDRMAFFEGFHQGVPSGWDKVGTWSQANDQLTGNATGPGHFALIVTDRTRETITAEITVVSVAGAASQVGLLDNKMQNGAPAIACALTGTPEIKVYPTTNVADAQASAYQLTAGQTYQVKLRRDNSTYTCSAANGSATAMVTKTITLNNAPYLSGLMIDGASIRVNWIMIVESL